MSTSINRVINTIWADILTRIFHDELRRITKHAQLFRRRLQELLDNKLIAPQHLAIVSPYYVSIITDNSSVYLDHHKLYEKVIVSHANLQEDPDDKPMFPHILFEILFEDECYYCKVEEVLQKLNKVKDTPPSQEKCYALVWDKLSDLKWSLLSKEDIAKLIEILSFLKRLELNAGNIISLHSSFIEIGNKDIVLVISNISELVPSIVLFTLNSHKVVQTAHINVMRNDPEHQEIIRLLKAIQELFSPASYRLVIADE